MTGNTRRPTGRRMLVPPSRPPAGRGAARRVPDPPPPGQPWQDVAAAFAGHRTSRRGSLLVNVLLLAPLVGLGFALLATGRNIGWAVLGSAPAAVAIFVALRLLDGPNHSR
jgi:hypothetical protein